MWNFVSFLLIIENELDFFFTDINFRLDENNNLLNEQEHPKWSSTILNPLGCVSKGFVSSSSI